MKEILLVYVYKEQILLGPANNHNSKIMIEKLNRFL